MPGADVVGSRPGPAPAMMAPARVRAFTACSRSSEPAVPASQGSAAKLAEYTLPWWHRADQRSLQSSEVGSAAIRSSRAGMSSAEP